MRVTRVHAAFSVLALLLLAACGGGTPPQQNYAVVTGRAYDSTTNQPVPGVTVAIAVIDVATTGADGTYRIANVPLGSEFLVVTGVPSGYTIPPQFQNYAFSVAAGQILNVDIPLTHQ